MSRRARVCHSSSPVAASSPLQTPLVGRCRSRKRATGRGCCWRWPCRHACAVDGRAPLQTAGGAARAGLGHPTHGAGVGVERPVLAALLPGADELERLARAVLHREQRRRLAEVVVGTRRFGAVGRRRRRTGCSRPSRRRRGSLGSPTESRRSSGRAPGSSRSGCRPAGRPAARSGSSPAAATQSSTSSGDRRSCCRWRCRPGRAWCRSPASCPTRRCRCSPRGAMYGLPQDRAGVEVEREHAAAERATR